MNENIEVGQVWANRYGEEFEVRRVEELPAEQGYAVGAWLTSLGERVVRDELRFNTLLGGEFKLVRSGPD